MSEFSEIQIKRLREMFAGDPISMSKDDRITIKVQSKNTNKLSVTSKMERKLQELFDAKPISITKDETALVTLTLQPVERPQEVGV